MERREEWEKFGGEEAKWVKKLRNEEVFIREIVVWAPLRWPLASQTTIWLTVQVRESEPHATGQD